MKKIMDCFDYVMGRAKNFTMLDYSLLKTCLFSAGVLFGSAFSDFFKKLAPLMWLSFIGSYSTLIYRMFFGQNAKEQIEEESDFEY